MESSEFGLKCREFTIGIFCVTIIFSGLLRLLHGLGEVAN